MAPREGLELELMKMGRTGPPLEPRRGPQAGRSGDPRSQNADSVDPPKLMPDLLLTGTIDDKTYVVPTWTLPHQQLLGPFVRIFDQSNI